MKSVVITPTKDRPQYFALLEKYMSRQTVKPDVWIVVCNGDVSQYTFTQGQEVYSRSPLTQWGPANEVDLSSLPAKIMSSLNLNLLHVVERLRDFDRVAVWEDDDVYFPTYLETLFAYLDDFALAGSAPCKYYNVALQEWKILNNTIHCSLAQTGFRTEVLPLFEECCKTGDPFIDWNMWRKWDGSKRIYPNQDLHVGIKDGNGIGEGHKTGGTKDDNFETLKRWIGEEYSSAYMHAGPASVHSIAEQILIAADV